MRILDKEVFKNNLLMCINELGIHDYSNLKFKIVPVVENGKNLNSTDDYMRLTVLSEKNLGDRLLELDTVINYLSAPHSTFPIWAEVEVCDEMEEFIIELRISQRFRKPSLLRNQETGHPPFKSICKST